jgi:hypothetical protein
MVLFKEKYLIYLVTADRARMQPTRTLSATMQRPRRHKPDAHLGQICVAADGSITLRRPAGAEIRRIFRLNGTHCPFASGPMHTGFPCVIIKLSNLLCVPLFSREGNVSIMLWPYASSNSFALFV